MKKNYIKKNIIGFIVGVILCMGSLVYAAVTFPSNEVSYDNSESGLSSTTVKGAIDELYTECTKEPSTGETIIEDAGLEKDPYECRYFFTGANPNNYITFNNETAGWRIISVECDGAIKIMKTASIGNQYWDTSGSNNWARPASLNTYLNGTYYNGLNATAQSQIVAKDWSIGVVTYDNNDLATQINNENSTKWNGKVALVTVSEYIRSNSNKSECGTIRLNNYNNNYINCVNTGWMDNTNISGFEWTLTPIIGVYNTVFSIGNSSTIAGRIDSSVPVHNAVRAVRPTLYLSSEVKITGGAGTQNNPYTLR